MGRDMSFEATQAQSRVRDLKLTEGTLTERPRRGKLPEPVRFADAAERERVCNDAAQARAIVLRPCVRQPGLLGASIEADLESALAVRGAIPNEDRPGHDQRTRVLEQLKRAAAVPVRGVCISLPPLEGICDADGLLSEADSRTLHVWSAIASAKDRSLKVVILFDAVDRERSLLVSQTLDQWLSATDGNTKSSAAEVPRSVDDGLNLSDILLERGHQETYDDAEVLETELPAPVRAPTRAADTLRPPPHTFRDVPAEPKPAAVQRRVVEEEVQEKARRLALLTEWRALALELDQAKGPKPVSSIEKLFVQKYLPLLAASMRGETDAAIRSIVDDFARSFSESYTEAYAALRVTGKRPTMVMDVFDVSAKIGRLSSARSLRLVLIDSMSFDLGERVCLRMKQQLDKRAVVVERTTLWSALPTNTSTQMHLLARGTEGLKEGPQSTPEPDISRGRNVAGLRRERVGSRELLKLDLVEARLRSPGPAYDERLDGLADEVAEVLVRYMETLPPRSLLYVFGDHGFVLPQGPNGLPTGPATQGGTSPEEVLVPGYAWLVDAVQ